jgi:uncharacterized protein
VQFWDSSAVVPLLVEEQASAALRALFQRDPEIVAWWATDVECVSALARAERDQLLESAALAVALGRLDALAASWQEIQPSAAVRRSAVRLLRVHPLRAADALQLAAAIVGSENEPPSLAFITLDELLALAAEREGFAVVRPAVA